jgi:GT2 family glycosyltransferase
MAERVPGFDAMPLALRARVRLLDMAGRLLNRKPELARRLVDAAPPALSRWIRARTAPLRIDTARPATLPVEPARARLDALPRASAEGGVELSVVIATFGHVQRLELCLLSIAAYSAPCRFELVVVDDASPNPEVVARTVRLLPGAELLRNSRNLGFARALNRGVAHTKGDVLVLMNDDVVVTPGWLPELLRVLAAERAAGLVGPTSNDTGDLATVAAEYDSLEGLLRFAERRPQRVREVDKVALHCALIRRELYDEIGGLDEGYGRGMFEDDDLSAAVRERGRRVLLADGAYVHHEAGSSFRQLPSFEYLARFEVNRRRFERKWRTRWRPRIPEAGERRSSF